MVALVRAVLQPTSSRVGETSTRCRCGWATSCPVAELAGRLLATGYRAPTWVERRGQFAQRGGIVDVFRLRAPHPVRLEFFGDEVDGIRSFSVADQRSLDVLADGLWAPVCREMLLPMRFGHVRQP